MSAILHEVLTAQLSVHEGLRLDLYRDSEGVLTIGYGRNLQDCGISYVEAVLLYRLDHRTAPVPETRPMLKLYEDNRGEWLIGWGYPIGERGINLPIAETFLAHDIESAIGACLEHVAGFGALDVARQAVVANMMFNLGWPRLSRFRRFLAALAGLDFERAAAEMKDSKWYRQVKGRGAELVRQMRTGELPPA
ncbi:hypothetical protein [Plasticicumulans sp.]|uniref:hypothetical protein n=1 Tax=Plasticicumulans sp. TaxID=2307179 RepID=UPI00322013E6